MAKQKLDLIFSKTNPRDKYARAAIQLKVHDLLLNDYDINHIRPRDIIRGPISKGPDSIDNIQVMTIANPLNKKAIVFNVGPKCGGPFAQNKGWQDFNIVQVIGGASVSKSWYDSLKGDRKSFFDNFRSPICFPLDQTNYETIIHNFQPDSNYKKNRQAFFLGNTQNLIGRIHISKILKKHPLFKIEDRNAGHGRKFEDYIHEMSKYKITLSLNGFAEACYRDWESMGIGVPIIRSEFYSQYDSPIIPNVHYIVGSEPTINGETVYKSSFQDIADQLIDAVETHIDNEDFLNKISENGKKYFIENLTCDAIVKKFMSLVNLNLLFDE